MYIVVCMHKVRVSESVCGWAPVCSACSLPLRSLTKSSFLQEFIPLNRFPMPEFSSGKDKPKGDSIFLASNWFMNLGQTHVEYQCPEERLAQKSAQDQKHGKVLEEEMSLLMSGLLVNGISEGHQE